MLTRQRIKHTLHRYDVPADTPDYGRAVAEALGVAPHRVFKTLVAEVDTQLTVAVVPVTGDLDLKRLAAVTGGKRAAVAPREQAERATGYVRGGISPLGQRQRLPTVIDESAAALDTILVSAGRRGLQVELPSQELIRLTGALLAPIARA